MYFIMVIRDQPFNFYEEQEVVSDPGFPPTSARMISLFLAL
jgi:hypothetical protein